MSTSRAQIINLRKSNKLTQEQFAQQLGYSRSYVNDIESGRSEASRRFLEAVIKKFGVSLDSLVVNGFEDWIDYIVCCTEEDYFVFIWGFIEEELRKAEDDVIDYLGDKKHVVIDAQHIKTYNEMISAIIGKKISKGRAQEQYEQFCLNQEFFFILIKNLSGSKIPQKGRNLQKLLSPSISQHVIVIDKPSFLEKYHDELYSYAKTTTAS